MLIKFSIVNLIWIDPYTRSLHFSFALWVKNSNLLFVTTKYFAYGTFILIKFYIKSLIKPSHDFCINTPVLFFSSHQPLSDIVFLNICLYFELAIYARSGRDYSTRWPYFLQLLQRKQQKKEQLSFTPSTIIFLTIFLELQKYSLPLLAFSHYPIVIFIFFYIFSI